MPRRSHRSRSTAVALAAAVLAPAAAARASLFNGDNAHAAYWTGGSFSDNNWGSSSNWNYHFGPDHTTGADTVLYQGDGKLTGRQTSNLDQNWYVRSVVFDHVQPGDPSTSTSLDVPFDLTASNGSVLTIAGGISNESTVGQTVDAPVRFNGVTNGTNQITNSQQPYNGATPVFFHAALTLNGTVDTNGSEVDVTASTDNAITINGRVTGPGSLAAVGPGTLVLTSTANDWTGGLLLEKGTVQFATGPNLGAITNDILFEQSDPSDAAHVPTLHRTAAGTTSGPVSFVSGEGRVQIDAGVTVTLVGPTYGTGTFGKTGGGTLVLSGQSGYNGSNGNTGPVHVYGGTLQVSGQARLPTNRVTVDYGSTLAVDAGIVDLIGALDGGGTVQLGAGAGLNVGTLNTLVANLNGNGTFYGTITGTGATLYKQGLGALVLTGGSSYSGTTTVAGGTLFAAATTGSATGTSGVVATGSGTFAGSGTVSGPITVNSGGALAPDNTQTTGSTVGTLTALALTVDAGGTVRIDVVGPTASTVATFDQVKATGNVTLNGGTLALTAANVPTGYARRDVIDAAGGRTGTFAAVSGQEVSPTVWLAVGYTPGGVFVSVARPGDATLDGFVDGADYTRVDAGYAARNSSAPLTGWANGDFNGDAKIDGSDYTLIDNSFNTQVRGALVGPAADATPTAEVAAVPEPATVGVVALALAGWVARRRRAR